MEDIKDTTSMPITAKTGITKANKVKHVVISILSVLLILVAVLGTLGFFIAYVPAKKLYSQIELAKSEGYKLKQAINDKDLKMAQISLNNLKTQTSNIESSYKKLSYFKLLPVLNNYYGDGQRVLNIAKDGIETGEILIKAVEPYQDFLGMKGASTNSSKTTEDRIAFLTESAESLVPHMDTIEKKLADIENQLGEIDAERYPEEFQGYQIKSNLLKAKEIVAETHKFIKNGQPLLTKTSWLLGKDKPRHYLMVFQNDGELRPTGGFWTAYGLLKVDNGKISPLVSEDIYALDERLKSTIPAPRPIKAYHKNVNTLHLRDMNLSPDFPTSIEEFLKHYNKISGNKEKVDAVIAIDTKVLVDMVKVLGQVGVFGLGNFSAEPDKRCDGCPQIIYQLEYIASKPKSFIDKNRKGFLSPLMHSLLANAMGSEKNKIGPLAEAMFNNIYEKHILFYFINEEMQKSAQLANISGSITQTDKNTDYFHLNDANMSSNKTNLFLKQKIKHQITVKNGKVEHDVSVTYTNPSPASDCNLERGNLCLNAPVYRDWFRFYVPAGSQLTKMTGSEVEPVTYDELGKQVFEGFYGNKYPLYAKNSLKTSVKYTSSIPASSDYNLLLQKQPGTKPVEYELWVNGKKVENFNWVADKTIKLDL